MSDLGGQDGKTPGLKFGIDLGTTYSSIGWYNPDTHQVEIAQLDAAQGSQLLPSAVYVESADNIVVGTAAIHGGLQKGERLARWFKRDMGNPAESRIVDGKQWTPVEFSTEILKTLKKEAEPFFTAEVKDVVITFPAFFDNRQKELTRDAAVAAGLNVIRMIEEPQAAALAYIIDECLRKAAQESRNVTDLGELIPQILERMAGEGKGVMVFDLGGGTFDVALVQARGVPDASGNTELRLKTLCNDGDVQLGGKDWDNEIKIFVRTEDQAKHQHDFDNDPQAGRMDDECEQAKKDLSRLTIREVLCTKSHPITVSRDSINQKTQHLVDITRNRIENVIARSEKDFGIPKENITLLLSGGMCNWPAVTDMLTEVMDGRAPVVPRNVNLMVTIGASYLAYLTVVAEERDLKGACGSVEGLADASAGSALPTISRGGGKGGLVLPKDAIQAPYVAIGIEVLDENDPLGRRTYISKIIPSEPEVGQYYDQVYARAYDNQTEVEITLYSLKERDGHKDEQTELSAWDKLKTFRMTGLPPLPKGEKVFAKLKYSEGGVIDGKAWDNSGKEIEIKGVTANG